MNFTPLKTVRAVHRLAALLAVVFFAAVASLHAQFTWIWSSGDLSLLNIPSSTISPGLSLQITTGGAHELFGQTLTNSGTITWDNGYIRGGNGSVLLNAAGGVFNDVNSGGYQMHNTVGGSFVFTNNGTYVRNATGITYIDVPFDNNGSVNVQQGSLEIRSGGTLSSTGSMTVAAGATIGFTSGYTIQDGASLSGAGTFHLSDGTMTVNGNIAVGTLLQTGGTLAGTNTITSGTFNWQNGTWSVGAAGPVTTIGPAATLNISTGSGHEFGGRGIVNQGTVNWSSGYLRSGNGGTFTNAAGATFNDFNAGSYNIQNTLGGSFVFTNNGTYLRNAAGITYVDVPFENNGIVNIQQGEISFRAGGTLASTGSIIAAAGTGVTFTSGYTIQNGSSLTGAGAYTLTGGTLTINGDVNVAVFNQQGGTLAGTNTIASGVFNWQNGVWSTGSPGPTTTISPSATLNIYTGSGHEFGGRGINNLGTVNWTLGYIRGGNGSTFTNAAGATFNDINHSSYSIQNTLGGSFVFTNNGSYVRNATGTTYVDVPFNNNGSVDIQQGEIQFRSGGTLASSGSIFAAPGTSVVFNNDYTVQTGSSLLGTGAYSLTSGTLTVNGDVNIAVFNQQGGTLAGNNTIATGAYNWNGGSWNTGTGATTIIGSPATLNIATGSSHEFNSRNVTNYGTVNWTSGYIRAGNGSTFTNAPGANFNDLNASGYNIQNTFGGSFVFTNNGTYTRNASNVTYVDVPFENNGVVNVQQGEIQFRAGGALASTGSIGAAAGASVVFTDGFTVQNGASLTGAGAFHLTGGTLTVNGAMNVASLTQSGGTLAGTNTITAGVFNWNSGTWNTGALGPSTTIGAAATLNIGTGSGHEFSGRTVVNEGTVNWTSGYIRAGNGSTFTNAAGGTFNDLNVSGYHLQNTFGGSFSFLNEGTYVRGAAGNTPVDIPFVNTGTLALDSGSLTFSALDLELTSTLDFSLGGISAASDYGVINHSGNLTLDGMLQLNFRNGFESTITAGNSFTLLNVSGGLLSGSFTNVASGTRLTTMDGMGSFLVNYGASSPFGGSTLVIGSFQAVPEPSTYALLSIGVLLIALRRWRGRART